MHVVGARFADRESATAALVEIRTRVPVAPGDVAVRPLGSTRYETAPRGFVLGGRFADHDVGVVVGIARARGGVIIERRLESVLAVLAPDARTSRAPSPEVARSDRRRAEPRSPRPRAPRVRTKRLRRPAAESRRTAPDRPWSGG